MTSVVRLFTLRCIERFEFNRRKTECRAGRQRSPSASGLRRGDNDLRPIGVDSVDSVRTAALSREASPGYGVSKAAASGRRRSEFEGVVQYRRHRRSLYRKRLFEAAYNSGKSQAARPAYNLIAPINDRDLGREHSSSRENDIARQYELIAAVVG